MLRPILEQRLYLEAPTPPQSVLDINWHSWREYLCELKKSHPSTEKSVRMQVNRGRRSGIIIETLDDPSPYLEEIYTILAGHFQRKNHSPYLMAPGYPRVLKERLGDRALFHVARKDERIIGVSIYVRYGAVMHWLGFGIANDYVRSRNSVYFNLAFHFPIEQACLNGECVFVCQVNDDCPTQGEICVAGGCQRVASAECYRDLDCETAPDCGQLYGAQCVAGECL